MAEESKKKSNINTQYNVASSGLNLDNSQNNIKKGSLSYALNAAVENYDSNSINYQNEPGNEECFEFPQGYVLVGKHFIPEQNKIIFFLTSPEAENSQIGYMENNNCAFRTLVKSPCLNFSIDFPIHRVVHKITNFGTELYWPDNNGRRYIDIDNIPYIAKDPGPNTKFGDIDCEIEYSNVLDCNKLLLQPDINIPLIDIHDVVSGGEITSGTYQFCVQYSDAVGNPYTSYYGVTNPTPIADIEIATVNFNIPVGKSIVVNVKNLNRRGQYQHFNLAVIATVNGISTPYLVGTYFIDDSTKQITYTGQVQDIQLSMNEIFERFTYYDKADYVTAVQDVLVWKGMTAVERLNYQLIANKLSIQWVSYRIPSDESYANELNATNYRGYLRDEVYPFEIIYLLSNGKETDGFHIPGRPSTGTDTSNVSKGSPDYLGEPGEERAVPRWEVYNTGEVYGFAQEYDPEDENYKGPYQYGKMSYWESTEEYPCDDSVWGELSGKKIRHHKMPDVAVSPIIEGSEFVNAASLVTEDVAFFPLGIRLDPDAVADAILVSDLTDEQKDQIIGYKIVRGDRGANKSIVAKGMLRNVGSYTKNEQDFYYPNYPYNDLNADPFLNQINNAWSQDCDPFIITVFEFRDSDELGPYLQIDYISCNNNKAASHKIREHELEVAPQYDLFPDAPSLGVYKVCSMTKPRIISPGSIINSFKYLNNNSGVPIPTANCVAFISYSEWEWWFLKVDNNYGSYIAGWDDPIYGLIGEGDAGGSGYISGLQQKVVRVRKGTEPFTIGDEGNGEVFTKSTTQPPDIIRCSAETPVEPISEGSEGALRQIFNSPETSFGQPFLGSILKLESVMYGKGDAHFVEVRDNAKYKLLTKEAQEDAMLASEKVGAITGTGSAFSIQAMFAVYQSYLTIYINGITRKNYAYSFNSVASYNYSAPIPNDLGEKQRNLDIKRYLIPGVLSVGEEEGVIVNNYQRETSVYLRTEEDLPYPHLSRPLLNTNIQDSSRFTISDVGGCSTPEKERDISVVSYYGSIKNPFVNQYGQIYSYEVVDTGYVKIFGQDYAFDNYIFGGDTFIGRFAYKTKVPFFIDNRVNAPDDSDIFYDEIGNIAYPKYWHSARSRLETYQGQVNGDLNFPNFISYKATNFDCPNDQTLPEGADPLVSASTNPDRTFYDGYFYMFAYGVPSFYCESSYNLDLRTAFNNKEGDFWPHVSTGIPDEWVQETNVSILNDNTYNYNTTFSKQNKETVITHLPADWGEENNRSEYPFRTVYSDKQITDADNRVNNWLTYRPVSYYDFPQNFGDLVALDSLQNSAILARFENKSLLYNNLLTMDTSNPQAVFVGNANFFANPPIDYADTDLGYVGCQNKMLLKTPYGAASIDAKRGQIFLINGQQVKDLTMPGSGVNRWFTAHLPFEILKHYPTVGTDNHFNGIGIHGVYDDNHERLIFTKIDYIPKNSSIRYQKGKWYLPLPGSGNTNTKNGPRREVFLSDPEYFCNVSWTISFNFVTNSWISFHSYIPNYYVGENNFFYSGMNSCPNDFDALVGVIDESLTTTTTTTIPVVALTTTTTSTTAAPADCTFDVVILAPDCELEGTAIITGTRACERPNNLNSESFISGYSINELAAINDSTVSSVAACANLSYWLIQLPEWSYEAQYVNVYTEGTEVGNSVFADNGTNDCSTINDGWYFTATTASIFGSVFNVVNGVIVEIVDCTPVTTTTTTTTLATLAYCFNGTIADSDPEYPLGGNLVYQDAFGDVQTLSQIKDTDTINIEASQIISSFGLAVCTTTTTTTT